jgi:protein-glutamine gamma-glutamyltransferase
MHKLLTQFEPGAVGPITKVEKLVRRRITDSVTRDVKELERRRVGTIAMAIVSILLMAHRRINYDSLLVLSCEMFVGSLLCVLAVYIDRLTGSRQLPPGRDTSQVSKLNLLSLLCVILTISIPWIANPLAKSWGNGNGNEIVMLSSLGWGGLAFSLLAKTPRSLSLSVVCSGFLTLFATFISDSRGALWFSLVWGVLCLWWLVNNYWSQVATAVAVGVKPARTQRILFTSIGIAIFLLGAALIAGRIPVLKKLQAELMPTSGGTTGKDSAARRGVGNGDALVAAKNHATSFGAVETDVFLESEKPSLFDVFSNEFGKPRKKLKRVERAQSLSADNIKKQAGKFTEGNRSPSGSEFSIERELPEERKPTDDLVAEALMFWQGESGAHLVVQRYNHFDGTEWSNQEIESAGRSQTIESTVIGEQHWFSNAEPIQTSLSPFIDALPEAIKFTRYRSPIVPTRQGLQLWSIDQIDQADFFKLSADGCLYMPDRSHVPDYTIVRMINSRIDLERLEDRVRDCSPGKSHRKARNDCQLEINRLAHFYAGQLPRGWPQVHSIINGLRNNFTADRSSPPTQTPLPPTEQKHESLSETDPERSAIEQFLQTGHGPDYVFATAAALMLDHMGYRTRFVTGFYANPRNYVARDREIAVLPSDAHAWLEIDVGHGFWIPLEPTPGYQEPAYSASLWFLVKQQRWALAMWFAVSLATGLLIYFSRRLLLELLVWLVYPVLLLLNDRVRVSWLARLLDMRLRLAGVPRTKGTVLRTHLKRLQTSLPAELIEQLNLYLDSADRIWYGGILKLSRSDRAAVIQVWQSLTVRQLQRGNRHISQRQVA